MSSISNWSKTAASNNSASPDGFPEGMPPSGVNDSMRETMAAIRTQWEQAEWFDRGHTPVFVSTTSFTIATDVTTDYEVNRRIKCVDATTLYGTIASSSYSSPNTTITVTLDSGVLSGSLASVELSALTTNDAIPDGVVAKPSANNDFTGTTTLSGGVAGDTNFAGTLTAGDLLSLSHATSNPSFKTYRADTHGNGEIVWDHYQYGKDSLGATDPYGAITLTATLDTAGATRGRYEFKPAYGGFNTTAMSIGGGSGGVCIGSSLTDDGADNLRVDGNAIIDGNTTVSGDMILDKASPSITLSSGDLSIVNDASSGLITIKADNSSGVNKTCVVAGGSTPKVANYYNDTPAVETISGGVKFGNDSNFSMYMNGLNPNIVYDSTDYFVYQRTLNQFRLYISSVQRFQLDATATSGNTALMIYDVDNATLERVKVGAADSGGTGYKVLRIAN